MNDTKHNQPKKGEPCRCDQDEILERIELELVALVRPDLLPNVPLPHCPDDERKAIMESVPQLRKKFLARIEANEKKATDANK